MLKNIFLYFFSSFMMIAPCSATVPKELILNWDSPTQQDLKTVQCYLDSTSSTLQNNEYGFRADHIKSLKIYEPTVSSYGLEVEHFGKTKSSFCIICYSSLNARYGSNYEKMLNRLRRSLHESGFSGDLLYRIGGWPNMEAGGLRICDVPYTFKLCAFEEAQRLGYSKALWLDTTVIVLNDLGRVFAHIEKNGAYFRKSKFPFSKKKIINIRIAQSLNTSIKKLNKTTHYASGILGFDLTNKKIKQLLLDWHELAEDGHSFYSCFPEQVPLSFLIQKHKLHGGLCPNNSIVFDNKSISKNTSFFVNYSKL